MSDLTPAMQQYLKIKEENPECVVLFRMGDFYETFYEDAKTASRVLGITLTSRGKGAKKAPLAGIPYHALNQYLTKLVKKGYKVALVEQLEDPKKAKGLVKRGLVRIVTPGTVIEDSILPKDSNNYIVSVVKGKDGFGIACCDISTGEFLCTEMQNLSKLNSEIARFSPSEIILPISLEGDTLYNDLKRQGYNITTHDDRFFWKEKATDTIKEQFNVMNLEGFGISKKEKATQASGALLSYIKQTQRNSMSYLKTIRSYNIEDYMILDTPTMRNLELLKNIRDNTSRGSLYDVINKTCTPMGARELKRWLLRPLIDPQLINKRLDAIEELTEQALLREEIREKLKEISDIERIIGRITYGSANARDLVSLKQALLVVPEVKELLKYSNSDYLKEIMEMEDLEGVRKLIQKAIKDEPSALLKEGNLIKKGFDKNLDDLKNISADGKSWINAFEAKERERSGIKSLKVRYNKVFGYFIEVTKANLHLVPDDYIRKQTQVNSERFITEELKEKESIVLGAHEKICALEYELFLKIIDEVVDKTKDIQDISDKVSVLDCIVSSSQVAVENHYCRPKVSNSESIRIRKGRHPVVERIEAGKFVDNDTTLDPDARVHIITGPNMAGKSTYLRQVALITILAQMGTFVPAKEAEIGIVDRVFTRVGAVDDLSLGQSTFMVEMTEVANILNNSTERSLVIMDEVGRGTSTYDGLSIAWAVTEYLDSEIKAKTLFATHYHQLNRLSDKSKTIKNYNISVKESAGDVIFLYKIEEGGTDKSYGIHVARLAGVPRKIIERARVIQGGLEDQENLSRSIAIEEPEEDFEVKREIRITETIKKKPKQLNLFEVIDNDKDS